MPAHFAMLIGGVAVLLAVIGFVAVLTGMRRRGMDRWVGTYIKESSRRRSRVRRRAGRSGPIHVLLCIADHYEPQHGKVDATRAAARVQSWVCNYPRLLGRFRDSDGGPPRHTFFFPIDEYDPAHLDALAELCRAGYGEVEIHHHHDGDTAEALRERLLEFKRLFRQRHGFLPHDKCTGEVKYGFVHGNWALDNSRPDGRWCGVNNELDVLRETGCYADFTMPSAPSPTQTRKINSIYYAVDNPRRPKSHNWGVDAGDGPPTDNALLLVQGPLVLNWKNRKAGILPRVENGNLQGNQPPTAARLDLWLRAAVQVKQRPDWYFVKLHTHGATERNQAVLLGEAMVQFHQALASRATADCNFKFHYVTAREIYNLVRAAEAGWTGEVAKARDFELVCEYGQFPRPEQDPHEHTPAGASLS